MSASIALIVAALAAGGSSDPNAIPDSSSIYSGIYASSFQESTFSPCDVQGIGSGWSLRFRNPRDGAFLQYQFASAGMPAITHFIRVRGRVSESGHYGLGFQLREIVVDSVLEMSESPQPCISYEEIPRPWKPVQSNRSQILGFAMSRDNSRVALFDVDGSIGIWNTRSGRLLRRMRSGDKSNFSPGSYMPMEFSPNGKRLAVGGSDAVVRVWNTVNGKRVLTLAAPDSFPPNHHGQRIAPISVLNFNRSGTILAAAPSAATRLWSMRDGKLLGMQLEGFNAKFLFLGDTAFIAGSDSGVLKIYPRLGDQPKRRIDTGLRSFQLLDRSADGRWLIAKSWADTAYLWSLSDGQLRGKFAIPGFSFRPNIAFSPDGKTIAIPALDGLYLWETATGKPIRSFQNYPRAYNAPRSPLTAGGSLRALCTIRFCAWCIWMEGRLLPRNTRGPATPCPPTWPGTGTSDRSPDL